MDVFWIIFFPYSFFLCSPRLLLVRERSRSLGASFFGKALRALIMVHAWNEHSIRTLSALTLELAFLSSVPLWVVFFQASRKHPQFAESLYPPLISLFHRSYFRLFFSLSQAHLVAKSRSAVIFFFEDLFLS